MALQSIRNVGNFYTTGVYYDEHDTGAVALETFAVERARGVDCCFAPLAPGRVQFAARGANPGYLRAEYDAQFGRVHAHRRDNAPGYIGQRYRRRVSAHGQCRDFGPGQS